VAAPLDSCPWPTPNTCRGQDSFVVKRQARRRESGTINGGRRWPVVPEGIATRIRAGELHHSRGRIPGPRQGRRSEEAGSLKIGFWELLRTPPASTCRDEVHAVAPSPQSSDCHADNSPATFRESLYFWMRQIIHQGPGKFCRHILVD
jgi:hypothetical protein